MCQFIKGKVLLLFACYAGVVTRENKRDVCMEHYTNKKYSYETNKPGLLCLKKMVSTGYQRDRG